MPTKSLETLLWREFSKAQMKEVIDVASPLLQEVVNYGTNVVARCQDSSKGEPDEDIALIMLYFHVLDMSDGIDELLLQGCTFPCIPVLRSSFEAVLSMKFILDRTGNYKERSLCWSWGYIHNEMTKHERYLSHSQNGQVTRKALKDEYGIELEPLVDNEAQRRINSLQKLLSENRYQPIEGEYQRLKLARKRADIEWYTLFGGPASIRQMAEQLEQKAIYILLYKYWSEVIHGQNLQHLSKNPDGSIAFNPLRNPEDQDSLAQIASIAVKFALEATRLLLSKFRPGEDISSWYQTEIQPAYRKLHGLGYKGPTVTKKVI